MDLSESLSSDASNGPRSAAPFPYQTRLLERASSRSGPPSLSRSDSQSSSFSLLTNTTGSSALSTAPRRWTSTHRVANSVDVVRGKWEERTRESLYENESSSSIPGKSSASSGTLDSRTPADIGRLIFPYLPSSNPEKQTATPKHLKRQTMPAIITSPLSPNSTGVSVEAGSPLSTTPQRIRIPVPDSPSNLVSWRTQLRETKSSSPTKAAFNSNMAPSRRNHVPETKNNSTSWSTPKDRSRPAPTTWKSELGSSITPEQRVPPSIESIHVPSNNRPLGSATTCTTEARSHIVSPSQVSPASVMLPTTYRSSNLSNKKANSFDALSAAGSRGRLGSHLPRIASGDGEDPWAAGKVEKKLEETSSYSTERARLRDRRFAKAIQERKLTPSGVLTNNGVAGLPGRISLKAPSQDSASSNGYVLLGASWADKQRHLLQAYEYLCHVGEAQQWIEGCLGEELECGVVELEDALQNGVILARLVRVFQGEAVVRKIFEVGPASVLLFNI